MSVEIAPPLPDELLSSTLARARCRLGFSPRTFSEYVLGSKKHSVSPFFQHSLTWIAGRLSETSAWKLSAEELRNSHTMFPFVAPFLTQSQRMGFQTAISHECRNRIQFTHIGRALKTTLASKLRYCEACRQDDLTRYGEAAWRRIHQLPELRFCTTHLTPLVGTNLSSHSEDYVPLASGAIAEGTILAAQEDRLQGELVEQIKELCVQPYFYPGWKLFRTALAFQLQKMERLVTEKTIERFLSEKYGEASAAAVVGPRNWLWHFLNRIDHPIGPGQLAVVCAAAGLRIGDVLRTARTGRQVYHSWWPCMSPVCLCTNRRTIHGYNPEPEGKSVRFTCPECRAAYIRPLPLVENWDGSFLHCLEVPHTTQNHRDLVA